jgi:hypothetical protein
MQEIACDNRKSGRKVEETGTVKFCIHREFFHTMYREFLHTHWREKSLMR